MGNLKSQIHAFLNEIEYTHLKKNWVKRLIEMGIAESEARVWAAEIGHVVDEYRSSLMILAKLLEETDIERIPELVHSFAIGIVVNTVDEIEEPMRYLEKQLEKYLPPEPDDEDE